MSIGVIDVWMFVMYAMIQESVLRRDSLFVIPGMHDAFVAKECCCCLPLCIWILLMSIFVHDENGTCRPC